jgi:hypothetical protein
MLDAFVIALRIAVIGAMYEDVSQVSLRQHARCIVLILI